MRPEPTTWATGSREGDSGRDPGRDSGRDSGRMSERDGERGRWGESVSEIYGVSGTEMVVENSLLCMQD